jgi:hypothetical protein
MHAAQAVSTLDADVVAAEMRQLPVNDFYHDDVKVEANGQMLEDMHVWRVKPSAKAAYKWDFYEPIARILGKDAFMPLDKTGCTLGGRWSATRRQSRYRATDIDYGYLAKVAPPPFKSGMPGAHF